MPPFLRSVLIADPDEAFRKYLAKPLGAQGFTIYEAADGAAAWQLAVQNRPWMILADISMPELDGFEFCRRVRSHPMLSRMPLLFISESDAYVERHLALTLGADDFLPKNMPLREMLMRIQLLMTRYSDLYARAPVSDEEAHEDAKRFARLVVTEIKLYNESQVSEGRKNQDIYKRLKKDIERGRQMYHERLVFRQFRGSAHYFYDALVGVLAGGDAAALGPVPSTLLDS